MMVAYELKLTLAEVGRLTPEEIAYWLAFFKRKNELEKQANKRNK